jgi:hypothetical protein
VCRSICSYWSSSPGCPGAQRCSLNSICFAESGDPAAIGAPCASGAASGDICGNDGGAWRGTCQDLGAGMVCTKLCRTGFASDCSTGQTCTPFTGYTVGVCT